MAEVLSFPGFKGCITVKLCKFLNLPVVLVVLFLPFTHFVIDKNLIVLIFCEGSQYRGDRYLGIWLNI